MLKFFLVATMGGSFANLLSGGSLLPLWLSALVFAANALVLFLVDTRPRGN